MSNTDEWQNRLARHRYSQDDRSLSWKFQKELDPKVNAFLDGDVKEKSLSLGSYDLQREPWRLLAVNEFRKYGLKVVAKEVASVVNQDAVTQTESDEKSAVMTEITLVRSKVR
jgi:hypothetical protein